MKKQIFPEFTAEATLSKANELFKSKTKFLNYSKTEGIIPQRIKLRTVHCDCDPQTDICVCDNGRVLNLLLG